MPWRNTKNPYRILVSEVMLQQTQVSRVLPKYKEFLKVFPTLVILARARIKRILQVWKGLGYWRRVLYLKETVKRIVKEHRGKFPKDPKELEKLPGIGRYTARALACFAFGNAEAFLDTNIRRVYLHFFFPKRKDVPDKEILPLAQKALNSIISPCNVLSYKITAREWHYALFDYGTAVLKDKKINKQSRHYAKQSKFEGSFRSFRTKVMRLLLVQKNNKANPKTIKSLLAKSPYPAKQILDSLLKDKLIKKSPTYYYL